MFPAAVKIEVYGVSKLASHPAAAKIEVHGVSKSPIDHQLINDEDDPLLGLLNIMMRMIILVHDHHHPWCLIGTQDVVVSQQLQLVFIMIDSFVLMISSFLISIPV